MNKKITLFIIFIALIFILNLGTSVIATITGTVNTETVRVREKASTDSDIVTLVSIGEKIVITGEEGDWYKVQIENETGYIRKDLLKVDELTENNSNTNNTNNNTQNQDEDINSINNENNNTNVNDDENDGQNSEISEDRQITTLELKQEELTVGDKITVAKDIKLKILPLANSNNIAQIVANTELTILEIMNNWCRIETQEYSGWIMID